MERERISILGCAIDPVDMTEAVQRIAAMVIGQGCQQVITLNAEIIYQAVGDQALQQMINRAELITPDGAGVVWAAKYLACPVKERVTGIDLVAELTQQGAAQGWKFYFLGASPGVVEEAARKLICLNPQLQVVGTNHGYFTPADEPEIVDAINRSGANILLVGLGAPRQDFWIDAQRSKLNCQVAIGVGGSFDVIAGQLSRAPDWMIKLNLEWFYRLIKEPTRWRRQLALPGFVKLVLQAGQNRKP